MPTFLEIALVLILLYVVYATRFPSGIQREPQLLDDDTEREALDRSGSVAEPRSPALGQLAPQSTTSRAGSPIGSRELRSVGYNVAARAQSRAEQVPTVHRVLGTSASRMLGDAAVPFDPFPTPTSSSSSTRLPSSDIALLPGLPQKLRANASRTPPPHMREIGPGLITPPASAAAKPWRASSVQPLAGSATAVFMSSSSAKVAIPSPTRASSSASRRTRSVPQVATSAGQSGRMCSVPPAPTITSSARIARPVSPSALSVLSELTELTEEDEKPNVATQYPQSSLGRKSKKVSRRSSRAPSVAIDDPFHRHFRTFRNYAGVADENGEPVGTGWFQSQSDSPIAAPPDFSTSPDVRVGDIFCHKTPSSCQMWLWVSSAGTPPYWGPIPVGHRRGDGRRLTLTRSMREPSWVM